MSVIGNLFALPASFVTEATPLGGTRDVHDSAVDTASLTEDNVAHHIERCLQDNWLRLRVCKVPIYSRAPLLLEVLPALASILCHVAGAV